MEKSLPARAEVHWDEASTDGEESEEELKMTEGEDNVELDGNLGLYCAKTGDEWVLQCRQQHGPRKRLSI